MTSQRSTKPQAKRRTTKAQQQQLAEFERVIRQIHQHSTPEGWAIFAQFARQLLKGNASFARGAIAAWTAFDGLSREREKMRALKQARRRRAA